MIKKFTDIIDVEIVCTELKEMNIVWLKCEVNDSGSATKLRRSFRPGSPIG